MNENTFAFPHEITHLQKPLTAGMTLRDYFAAKAMQALITCSKNHGDIGYYLCAADAYRYADAMMEVRK